MARNNGKLQINSENLFPIIKKWLYSDKDIFVRELISNGCDAVTKVKKLALTGDAVLKEGETFRIDVICDPEEKTLTFIDNGIGMDKDEVVKYIAQIAFSGAADFLEKYQDTQAEDEIIGHFGLGFYSAFMVADRVVIESRSYKEDAQAVWWECDGSSDYNIKQSRKRTRGTKITLYLNDESLEFSDEYRVREALEKYCGFMPVPIWLSVKEASSAGDEEGTSKEKRQPEQVNDTSPLWLKHPNECSDDDYKAFYRKVFSDYREPLFWIHLNMDYPFDLKGILYFPRIGNEYDSIEGTIKLFCNQVFIADNIKEAIPDYLMLLKGVIDCPDMPLNVSRSALQNDGFVKKISDYITKKVADRLTGMYKTEKEEYEKYWDDINPFIKYGFVRDEKFAEKMNDYIIYKDLDDKYVTLPEYLDAGKEKHENKVFYVTDAGRQASYIELFRKEETDALILNKAIDPMFIQALEFKNKDVKFMRIDSDEVDIFRDKTDSDDDPEKLSEELQELFRGELELPELTVKADRLKDVTVSSMITENETSRRMEDMMRMYGMASPERSGTEGKTLVLNISNPLVRYIIDNRDGENTGIFCRQLYDLAGMAHRPLSGEQLTEFVKRSNKIMEMLAAAEQE
ncbi:MAG: molecular chaperone HtpG [Lachnospiraceae bacterium]|nr:molecular chaperone HtpG [Lachnospiraceae bacterium]